MTITNFPAPPNPGLQISHTIHVPRDNGVWPEDVRVPKLNGHHHQIVVLCNPPLPPESAVPEPSTMALFGLAAVFVLGGNVAKAYSCALDMGRRCSGAHPRG